MKNLVSLLIPCYNGEKFLKRCFECILSQDYTLVEVIFVNDGSFDATESMAKQYGKMIEDKGYTFKYIFQKNQGAAAAINTALKHVNGEFIMLYDVDDIIFPQAISKKAHFLIENDDFGMVRNNGYDVRSDDLENKSKLLISDEHEKNNEYIFEDLVLARTNNWAGSYMIRSEILFNNILNKEIYISQFGQNLQIIMPVSYFSKCGYIDDCLMKYIRYNNSHSSFTDSQKALSMYTGYEENRIEILRKLDIPQIKKDKYIKDIKVMYCRIRMNIAYKNGDIKLLEKEYNTISNLDSIIIDDKILYRRAHNKIYDILCKSKNGFTKIFKVRQ